MLLDLLVNNKNIEQVIGCTVLKNEEPPGKKTAVSTWQI